MKNKSKWYTLYKALKTQYDNETDYMIHKLQVYAHVNSRDFRVGFSWSKIELDQWTRYFYGFHFTALTIQITWLT